MCGQISIKNELLFGHFIVFTQLKFFDITRNSVTNIEECLFICIIFKWALIDMPIIMGRNEIE